MATSADSAAAVASPVEIFYSYSHRDERIRERLEKHLSVLKRQGVITGWHDRKIGGGEEWAGAIDEHINSAQIILLLISADFLASDYCYDVEVKRAIERHEAGEAWVIPVILRPVDWSGAPFGKLQALPRDAQPITKWSNQDEAFKDVALGIRKVSEKFRAGGLIAPIPIATAGRASAFPRIWNVPYSRNANFTGREDLLQQIDDSLASRSAVALAQLIGLGGIGKTETVVEYTYRHASEYDLVWWVRSEDPIKLVADYTALAVPLQLFQRSAPGRGGIVQAIRQALARRGDWLLVFDGARTPSDLRDYLPAGGGGRVIVTSRNPAFGELYHMLKVQTLSSDEAVDFLLKRTQETDRSAAAALARDLGFLPLALEHAGAYIEKIGSSLAGYLELFRTRQHDILSRAERPVGYDATVATTWEISFREVGKESEAARQLMNLCAFLGPDDIPRDLLVTSVVYLPAFISSALSAALADDLYWSDTLGVLRRYSLVDLGVDAISVHPLVQTVTRSRLNAEQRRRWAEAVVNAVYAVFPFDVADTSTWEQCGRLLAHALAATGHSEALHVAAEQTSGLLRRVGLYLKGRAEFVAARSVHERALRIDEATFGSEHPNVANDVNNLGSVLHELGDLAGARVYFERALRIDEANYGPDHPNVANDVNNLGSVLRDIGDVAGARIHFERALKIDEAVYGPDHPTIATRVNNLGRVLQDLGDLTSARAHFVRALRIDEAAYGPDHPEVATDVNNLGSVLRRLGDLAGARAHCERALRVGEATFGPSHPTTAVRLNNLAMVAEDMGDRNIARALYERSLRILEQTLGQNDSRTEIARKNLMSLGRDHE